MNEKPKSRHADLRGKIYAFLSLPYCVLSEAIPRLNSSKQEKKDYIAQHEAGHALVYLLAGRPIEKATIGHLQLTTRRHLHTLLEPLIPAHAGGVALSKNEDREFTEAHPDKNVLQLLAAFASTQNSQHEKFLAADLKAGLAMGVDAPWDDISVPWLYVRDRFEALCHRPPTNQEVSEIFQILLEKIKSVFTEDKFAKALGQIKDLIKGRKLKKSINDVIMESLYSTGFSPDDITDMQGKLFSIDIDQIIQNYHRPAI